MKLLKQGDNSTVFQLPANAGVEKSKICTGTTTEGPKVPYNIQQKGRKLLPL